MRQRCSICKRDCDSNIISPWPQNCDHCLFFKRHNPDFQCKCYPKPTCEDCSKPIVGFCNICKRKAFSHPDICEWCIERIARHANRAPSLVYCWVCHKFVRGLKRCVRCQKNKAVDLNCPTCMGVVPMCVPCFSSRGGWNTRPQEPEGHYLTWRDVTAGAVSYRLSRGTRQYPGGARKFTRWNTKPEKKEKRRAAKESWLWNSRLKSKLNENKN